MSSRPSAKPSQALTLLLLTKPRSGYCQLQAGCLRIKAFLRGRFARDVFLYASGTAGGQAITAIAGVLLLRLYSPQAIGIFGVYAALLGMIASASSMRYEMAIPIAPTPEDAVNLAYLCATLITAACLIAWAILAAAGQFLPAKFQPIRPFIPLLILGVFCLSVFRTLAYINLRVSKFDVLAKSTLTQSATMAGIQIGAGGLGAGPAWLMVGHVAGQAAGAIAATRGIETLGATNARVSTRAIGSLAKLYERFPKFSAPAALMNTVGSGLPVLALAGIFGLQVAGWFAVVTTAAAGPLSILGKSIGRVNFADMANAVRAGDRSLREILVRRALLLAAIGAAAITCANVAAWLLVQPLLGTRWNESVFCLQALSPWLLLDFVSSPLGYALDATQRQDLHLLRETMRLLSLVLAIVAVAHLRVGWRTAVGIFSGVGCGDAVIYLACSFAAVSKPRRAIQAAI